MLQRRLVHIASILLASAIICSAACHQTVEPGSKYVATVDRGSMSPDGTMLLRVDRILINNVRWLRFAIFDQSTGALLYQSPDKFQERLRNEFLWGAENRVWVNSSDVGIYYWQKTGDRKSWVKFSWIDDMVPVPEYLIKKDSLFDPKNNFYLREKLKEKGKDKVDIAITPP